MPGGQPPFFDSPEMMKELIDEFFENPPKKTVIIQGNQIEVPAITITGLAIHLGFDSRQSFYDYEKKPKFSYILKRARLFVENNYEFLLTNGSTPTGAIFALKNMGWSDRQELDHQSSDGSMTPKETSVDKFASILSDYDKS